VQADILDRCPDNRQATGLGREHINLIRPLPYIAEQTLDGIGGADVAMHARSASTSLLPARSTPRAVRITVEST